MLPILNVTNENEPEDSQEVRDSKNDNNDSEQIVKMNNQNNLHDWEVEQMVILLHSFVQFIVVKGVNDRLEILRVD